MIMTLILTPKINVFAATEIGYATAANGTKVGVHKVNGNRDADTVIIYTSDYGSTTKTGKYGVEVIVDNGIVVSVKDGRIGDNVNDSTIPMNGYVISTIDTSGKNTLRDALAKNFKVGEKVVLDGINLNPIKDVTYTFNKIDPALTPTPAFPGDRGANEMVIYTPAYGSPTTLTNTMGTEVVVVDGKVTEKTGYNSTIPQNGFVVSGHGTAKSWIDSNMIIGAKVFLDSSKKTLRVVVDKSVFIEAAQKDIDNAETALKSAKAALLVAPLDKAEKLLTDAKLKITAANETQDESLAIQYAKEAKFIAFDAYYNTIPSNTIETRGVWHRPTEKTINDVRATLDKFALANINTVFLETFYHGYVIYPSKVADTRPEFASLDFDLMQTFIEEGAKRGIEIHAWVEDFYVGNKLFAKDLNKDGDYTDAGETSGSPILDKHPEWAAKMKNGATYLTSESGYMFMNAAMPEVRNYLSSLYKEIISKYKVMGLQLDYIRYPLTDNETNGVGYDDYSRAEFTKLYGIDPINILKSDSENWNKFNNWKINNITTFVNRIHDEVKGTNADIQISTAVFPDMEHAKTAKSQNWAEWIEKGYLDFISPMAYLDFPDAVKSDVKFMVDNYGQVSNYAGICPMFHKLRPIESAKQVEAVRQAGAKGVVFFDSKDFTTEQIHALVEGPFRNKAVSPHLYKLENEASKVTIEGVSNGYYNTSVKPTIKIEDKYLISSQITLNGAPYGGEEITADGNYELIVTSVYFSGNKKTNKVNFVIDKTAPVITVSGVENNKTYDGSVTPVIKVDDDNAIINVTLNGGLYDNKAINKNGQYILAVKATDKAGNISELTVNFTVAIELITTNTDTVIGAITGSAAGSTTVVKVAEDNKVDPSILKAIEGTDKTIVFQKDGVTWSFNGKDITKEIKTLDLSVKVGTIKNSTSPNKDAIAAKVKGKNVMVITFAENGVLPGAAKVTINLGSAWANKNNLFVYYYNPQTKNVEKIDSNLKADSNGNITFAITHCSDYFVVDKDLISTEVMPKTGSPVDMNLLIGLGALLVSGGLYIAFRRKATVK